MKTAPRSLRLHIGIFGRTNVGKSSFINMLSGQDVSITSSEPGTTTDVVEKQMELQPLGPVLLNDTAGLDDKSGLGKKRLDKTNRALKGTDIAVLVVEPNSWTDYEKNIVSDLKQSSTPFIIAINKTDSEDADKDFIKKLENSGGAVFAVSAVDTENRDSYINNFKDRLIKLCPDDFLKPPPLLEDLLEPGQMALLIVPIDLEAPKGRLILPQVQTIRSGLDSDCCSLIVKDNQYPQILNKLSSDPQLVICDSQVVNKMVHNTPPGIECTTFSILFARRNGDLKLFAQSAREIDNLKDNDRILIGEACSHHPVENDIGREQIPRLLEEHCACRLNFDVYSGYDFPDDLEGYRLIIHCGGCMINRRRMLTRLQQARQSGVPITNYGLCLSYLNNCMDRTLSPFKNKEEDKF